MKEHNLILISTHQNNFHVLKLINSIHNNIKNIKVLLLIVSQECKITYESQNPLLTITFINEVKMGLSKARNIALKYLSQNFISAEYIMFPDDDSSFNDCFFIHFPTILGTNKCYITPIYNEGTKNLYLGKKIKDGELILPVDHKLIGSPNQIILYNILKKKIIFNEELGVGAKYGSCEDLDLFLSLYINGNSFYFINKIYTFHPKKIATYKNMKFYDIIKRFKNYSSGFAYVVFKFKEFVLIPEYLIRTLGAFIMFLIRLELKLSFAYFIQFFIRIQLLCYFLFNKSVISKCE